MDPLLCIDADVLPLNNVKASERVLNDIFAIIYVHVIVHSGDLTLGGTVFSNAAVVDRYYRLQSGGRVFEFKRG